MVSLITTAVVCTFTDPKGHDGRGQEEPMGPLPGDVRTGAAAAGMDDVAAAGARGC